MQLTNKVALVTGAGSGIGRASAKMFAQAGAKVGLVGRTESELREAAAEIEKAAGAGTTFVAIADVSNSDAIQKAIDDTAVRFGKLDIVMPNAGINGVWAPIEELTMEEWNKTIGINLTGTFATIKFAVPHLKRAGGGSIIVVASVNGTRIFSNTGATAYSTSKAGQVAMTKMLALELATAHIRVNVICPGAIDTEIDDNTQQRDVDKVKIKVDISRPIPLTDKPGTSDQVAQLALFLASDMSSHITGTPVWIDGAQSLLQG
jgi:NAD(P)-dependent dehydrogenase (short-subunit alcohol dehydrogenase family)